MMTCQNGCDSSHFDTSKSNRGHLTPRASAPRGRWGPWGDCGARLGNRRGPLRSAAAGGLGRQVPAGGRPALASRCLAPGPCGHRFGRRFPTVGRPGKTAGRTLTPADGRTHPGPVGEKPRGPRSMRVPLGRGLQGVSPCAGGRQGGRPPGEYSVVPPGGIREQARILRGWLHLCRLRPAKRLDGSRPSACTPRHLTSRGPVTRVA